MLPKNCGKLLYNAVRETLEIMAFADVVPCSIKVAGEEFAQDDDFAVVLNNQGMGNGWGVPAASQEPADGWETASSAASMPGESWGDSPEPTTIASVTTDDWGTIDDAPVTDATWGGRGNAIETAPNEISDPWGDSNLADACVSGQNRPEEADFDEKVTLQAEWCWACMNVNSPDVHSVWFVIPQSLAHALMQNMYAGENMELNTPLVRDLIAELTNVLGGRLMLLLEEMGGKFTLTVPDIGFGFPDIPEVYTAQSIVCKIVVDNEHPVIVVLCFNQEGVLAAD